MMLLLGFCLGLISYHLVSFTLYKMNQRRIRMETDKAIELMMRQMAVQLDLPTARQNNNQEKGN